MIRQTFLKYVVCTLQWRLAEYQPRPLPLFFSYLFIESHIWRRKRERERDERGGGVRERDSRGGERESGKREWGERWKGEGSMERQTKEARTTRTKYYCTFVQ